MFRADQVYRKNLFDGQAILLTGGGSGIGRRLAHGFASLGGSLALLGRCREKLEETAAAKAGIVNLGRTLGSEWAEHKIRINDVSPGPVFTKGSFDRLWLNEKIVEEVKRRVPLGRFPEPDDIVGPVLFLAHESGRGT